MLTTFTLYKTGGYRDNEPISFTNLDESAGRTSDKSTDLVIPFHVWDGMGKPEEINIAMSSTLAPPSTLIAGRKLS